MHAAADRMKEFTGVLVSRKYRPGQTYIQLLFRTTDDIQLCLSRNLHMVRELRLGQTYQVHGQRYSMGQKEYVHDPVPTLIQSSTGKRRAWFAASAICLTLLLGAGGVFALQSGNDPAPAPAPKFQNSAEGQQTLSEQTEEPQPEPTDTPSSTDQPASDTVVPTTTSSTPAASTRSTTTRSSRTTSKPATQSTTQTPETPPQEPPVEETPPEPTPGPPADPPAEPPTEPTP